MGADKEPAPVVGAGLVFGAGLGATVATIAAINVASGAGFGIAGGIVLAAAVSWLNRRGTARLVPVGGIAGGILGGAVGTVAAWSHDAAYVTGAAVGMVLGLCLGAFLAWLAGRTA